MIQNYRFYINGHSVSPIYSDDLSTEYNIESNQKFLRQSINGKLKLQKDDYTWLKSQPFETQFTLIIEELNGVTWSQIYSGKFTKMDCNFDDDDLSAELKSTPIDRYENILSVLDKEVNLVDLAPVIERINFYARPVIQVYLLGSRVLSNFTAGGAYWDEEVEPTWDNNYLHDTCKFSALPQKVAFSITKGATPEVSGVYVGTSVSNAYEPSGLYKQTIESGDIGTITKIIRISDNAVLFESPDDNYMIWEDCPMYAVHPDASGMVYSSGREIKLYQRIILNSNLYNGITANVIPTNDIAEPNKNYKYCVGYPNSSTFVVNNVTSTEPTKYGRNDFKEYFTRPITGDGFFPLCKNAWGNESLWFNMSEALSDQFDSKGHVLATLMDAYPIHSVLDVLLKKFVPELTFSNTPAYSEFLYAEQNPISFQTFYLFITQKTNVFYTKYDRPAQKATITLGSVLNMLKYVYKCFWHIDDDSRLRIEHVAWYANGGSYYGSQLVGRDLTVELDTHNTKPLDFGQSKFNYDKASIPSSIQFKWMDEVSESFEGYPIEIQSVFAKQGHTENVSVDKFTTDIDYIFARYNSISDDGFALLSAVKQFDNIPAGVWLLNYKLSYLTGGIYTEDGYKTSPILGIEPETDYYINPKWRIAWYNASNVFISGSGESDQTNIHRSPPNAAGVRMCLPSSYTNSPTLAKVNTEYSLPIVERIVDTVPVKMQNGYMSWFTLHPTYYKYDAPSSVLRINNVNTNAITMQKNKIQTIQFPSETLDISKLIKTSIGSGFIDKISLNLSSRIAKITLRHETQ